MSGFEMHRFRTIDRSLTQQERAEIDSWSSRFSSTSNGVTYIYHYGSFKKDVNKIFHKYFDAMLYVDNWGTRQLMFRFPKKLVKWRELLDFTNTMEETYLDFRRKDDSIIMDLQWNIEEGGGWMEEDDFLLDPLLSLRNDIIAGDYRALMLGWLKVHQERQKLYRGSGEDLTEFEADFLDEFDEDELLTPSIPPNMKNLGAAYKKLIETFEIDKKIVKAAAENSSNQKVLKTNYKALLKNLNTSEKDEYLLQLVANIPTTRMDLIQKLESFKEQKSTADNRLSWQELENILKEI